MLKIGKRNRIMLLVQNPVTVDSRRRVPQNPARSVGFCTSVLPTPHRFMLFVFVSFLKKSKLI